MRALRCLKWEAITFENDSTGCANLRGPSRGRCPFIRGRARRVGLTRERTRLEELEPFSSENSASDGRLQNGNGKGRPGPGAAVVWHTDGALAQIGSRDRDRPASRRLGWAVQSLSLAGSGRQAVS